MSWADLGLIVVSGGVFFYLLYALIFPERF